MVHVAHAVQAGKKKLKQTKLTKGGGSDDDGDGTGVTKTDNSLNVGDPNFDPIKDAEWKQGQA